MAPPSHRRPGFSRKAQIRIFTAYVVAAFGALAGLALIIISFIDPVGFSALRNATAEIVAPIGRTFAGMSSAAKSGGSEVAAYWDAAEKNAQLQRQVEATRDELREARALKRENERLKELLSLKDGNLQPIVYAPIIGSTLTSTRQIATIGRGYRQGVKSGQPVRSHSGLIGRVLEAGPNTARVLLVVDTENVIPVRRAKDDSIAFVQGRGDGLLDVRLVNLGLNPLKAGDLLVTTGSGGLYSPNIVVATIIRPTSDGAIAKPVAQPGSADYVAVLPEYDGKLAEEARRLLQDAATASEEDSDATEDAADRSAEQ